MPISRTLSALTLAAALALSGAVLTGCSDELAPAVAKKEAAAGSETSAAPSASAGTLEYASMKDIRDINPHLYLGEMAAQAMVFEALVENTPEGVKPKLAESWEISEDGRTYVFHLRKDVKFTDGTAFDAAAVKANVDAVLANRSRHAWLDMVNEIEGNDVVDEHTWRLRMKHAYFPTLVELGLSRPFRFISPACMKEGGTKSGVTCLVGTGPWVLSEHKLDQYAVFARNDAYWGEKPSIAAVRWNVIPDPQTMLMALEKGEIDLVFGADGDQLTGDAFAALTESGKLRTALSEPVASRAILVNAGRPVTSDLRVREAVQYAVNRDAIVQGILHGTEAAAETLFAKNVPYCDIPLTVRGYDPKKAEAILDAAGWVKGKSGVREKNGEPLSLRFYFNAQNAQEKTIAEAIQADLAKIGVDVRVIGEEKQAFLDRQKTGDFELQYSLSWGAPYDPQSYLSSWRIPAHGDYQAQRGLAQKHEIDATITALMTEPDEGKRADMVKQVLTTITDAAVYIPISYSRTKAVYGARVGNVGFAVTQYEIPFERMTLEAK